MTEPDDSPGKSSRGSQKNQRCKFRAVVDLDDGHKWARRPEDLVAKVNVSAEKCNGVWHEDKECTCVKVETCKSCETCEEGKVKHHPWDELEMLKHGWEDAHGRHWGGAKQAEDEVELMHHGLVTSKGAHLHAEPRKKQQTVDHLGEKGRVSFGRDLHVRQFVFSPETDDPTKLRPSSAALCQFGCMNVNNCSIVNHILEDMNPVLVVAVPLILLILFYQIFIESE